MSATLIARQDKAEAWQIGDEVFIRRGPGPMDVDGTPSGVRWECSRTHWDRYFDTVWSPVGWTKES